MDESKWHRRISPVFVALLVIAGLGLGFVGHVAISAVLANM